MAKDARKLKQFYARLDSLVGELMDIDLAAEVRRVRRALID